MTTRPLVLVPPSLAKSTGGRRTTRVGYFDGALRETRLELLGALVEYLAGATPEQVATLFSARGELLAHATASLGSIAGGSAPSTAAWHRYQGVVWTHLDPSTLSVAERRRIVVPSGLYGLVTGEDPIADYRLKMNVSVPEVGVVARFWRPSITARLVDMTPHAPIVNLLPKEHAAAVDFATLAKSREIVHVHFVAHDERRAIGHDAKAIKGLVARAVLRDGLRALDTRQWPDWEVRRDGDDVIVSHVA